MNYKCKSRQLLTFKSHSLFIMSELWDLVVRQYAGQSYYRVCFQLNGDREACLVLMVGNKTVEIKNKSEAMIKSILPDCITLTFNEEIKIHFTASHSILFFISNIAIKLTNKNKNRSCFVASFGYILIKIGIREILCKVLSL